MALKFADKFLSYLSFGQSLILVDSNILYLSIPKTGSSFLKSSIISSNYCHFSMGIDYPHSAIFRRPSPLLSSLSDFKIVAFIRDPIKRFCSVFREKVLANSINKGFWSPYRIPTASKSYVDRHSEFISDLISAPRVLIDKHLLPQSHFLSPHMFRDNFFLFRDSCISDFVKMFPNHSSALPCSLYLRTDGSLFAEKDLTPDELCKLQRFYASDLHLHSQALTALPAELFSCVDS